MHAAYTVRRQTSPSCSEPCAVRAPFGVRAIDSHSSVVLVVMLQELDSTKAFLPLTHVYFTGGVMMLFFPWPLQICSKQEKDVTLVSSSQPVPRRRRWWVHLRLRRNEAMMPRAKHAFPVRREYRHGQKISGNTHAQTETCTCEELSAVYRHGVAMVLLVCESHTVR